ncbi:MAG: glycosyltransferase family 2 protein [Nitrososphaerota archaeon]
MFILVIPTLNEEEGIMPTIKEYRRVMPDLEILIIDGGSIDKTRDYALNAGARVLHLNKKGKGVAVAAALEYLRKSYNPEFVIFTDGDHSYPADYLPKMIKLIESDKSVGAVLGDRLSNAPRSKYLTDIYFFGNFLIRGLYRYWRSINLRDPLSGLRVVRWRAISDWKPFSKGFEIETEMNLYILSKGWRIMEVPINYRRRIGKKKLKIRDAIPIIRTLRRFPFTP